MHSVADLTTHARVTTGDIPPHLVVCCYPRTFSLILTFSLGCIFDDRSLQAICLRESIILSLYSASLAPSPVPDLGLKGGRYNVENKMAADIYELDLKTWIWVKLESHPEDETPPARYFHSADACEHPPYHRSKLHH